MRTAKFTASEKLWAEKSDLKGSGIGSIVLLAIMAVALFLIS
jgi:hypothetical protein